MKAKVISGLSALFLLILFFVLMPIDVLGDWIIASAIIGSILFAVSMGVFLFSFKPKGEKDYFWEKAILTFASFWAFSILLIFYQSEREVNELENNGRYTVGRVIDGTSMRGRRSSSHKVKIRYRSHTGEIISTKENVSERQFQELYKGARVPLLHSKNYPQIVRILNSQEEIAKYPSRTKSGTKE